MKNMARDTDSGKVNGHESSKQGAASHSDRQLVLVGDDEQAIREPIVQYLTDSGYDVVEASNGQEALKLLTSPEDQRPDIALLDIRMPEPDGTQILQRMRDQGIETPVIMITGLKSSSTTIKVSDLGAVDYIPKPVEFEYLTSAIKKALRYEALKRGEGPALAVLPKIDPSERIVGSDLAMIEIFKTIGLVARKPETVLVTGETGTGKELLAEAIHTASRRTGPFVKVNCVGITETLIEDALFGHEKGAYTNALTMRKGMFELANKGTIFLDEIGSMTPNLQVKLLRVLQEREFYRVGGTEPIKVDVRVVAATDANLAEDMASGRFLEQLYHRLNVVRLHLSPLRERMDDVPELVSHFLGKHRASPVAPPARITQEAMDKLLRYDWPGNVRELESCIQQAIVYCRGNVITVDQIVFSKELRHHVVNVEKKVRARTPLDEMLRDIKREAIQVALRLTDNDIAKAATQLGLTDEQLRDDLAELHLHTEAEPVASHSYSHL